MLRMGSCVSVTSLVTVAAVTIAGRADAVDLPEWNHLSSKSGELPDPNGGNQQTACVVFDVDKNGRADIVIAERTRPPSVVWLRSTEMGWKRYLVDATQDRPEAGGTSHDVDGDGDADLILGGDAGSDELWWYENPHPEHDPAKPWTKRIIKKGGGTAHHDQIVADFDGDGRAELAFWNQNAKKLFLAEIPYDPRTAERWSLHEIFTYAELNVAKKQEGMDTFDVDGDGKLDLLAGRYWFKHSGGHAFKPIQVTEDGGRIAAGRFKPGKTPQIVIAPGDGNGPLRLLECRGDPAVSESWGARNLLDRTVIHGHTLEVADINGDGNLDIFAAEMHTPGSAENGTAWILYGDGRGNFHTTVFSKSIGHHESRVADVNGDGRLDIVGKPYTWDTPRVDVWLNLGTRKSSRPRRLPLDRWRRHLIEPELAHRAIYVAPADLDGDGQMDLVAGAWWYRNPGTINGTWARNVVGDPFLNVAAAHDFDRDGDVDLLGTRGRGAEANAEFVWARNDGRGRFTILRNIASGDGDFLQGVAVDSFDPGVGIQIALSWHASGKGVQLLSVPANPSRDTWSWRRISSASLNEDLSAADVDGDGDHDLLLGTRWLENPSDPAKIWPSHAMGEVTTPGSEPDRNNAADFDGDGQLDLVVGLENGTDVLLFRSPRDPSSTWTRTVIGREVGGGFSMDTADFDQDGDPDVVLGEHRGKPVNRVILYENIDRASAWREHVIDAGPPTQIDHHDGTVAVDLDGDGDLDLVSIGWYNPKLWIYENLAVEGR